MRARDEAKLLRPFILPCDVCGKPAAGTSTTEKGARAGLAFHKRAAHGVVGSLQRNRITPSAARHNAPINMRITEFLTALGEYLEESGVSIR